MQCDADGDGAGAIDWPWLRRWCDCSAQHTHAHTRTLLPTAMVRPSGLQAMLMFCPVMLRVLVLLQAELTSTARGEVEASWCYTKVKKGTPPQINTEAQLMQVRSTYSWYPRCELSCRPMLWQGHCHCLGANTGDPQCHCAHAACHTLCPVWWKVCL